MTCITLTVIMQLTAYLTVALTIIMQLTANFAVALTVIMQLAAYLAVAFAIITELEAEHTEVEHLIEFYRHNQRNDRICSHVDI